MVAITKAGSGWSQKPETLFRAPKWVAGPQALGPVSAIFRGTSWGSWVQSGTARTWIKTEMPVSPTLVKLAPAQPCLAPKYFFWTILKSLYLLEGFVDLTLSSSENWVASWLCPLCFCYALLWLWGLTLPLFCKLWHCTSRSAFSCSYPVLISWLVSLVHIFYMYGLLSIPNHTSTANLSWIYFIWWRWLPWWSFHGITFELS